MAAAATARLQPTLLDPQLLGEEVAAAAEAASATVAASLAGSLQPAEQPPSEVSPSIPIANGQPWGELTYGAGAFQTHPLPVVDNMPHHMMPLKGGFRLGGEAGAGVRARHSRARFDPTRRKQVQEVRKIGACIRCRVLRKTCSQGSPCDTCRKVLSPRVWRSGCVRTKFSETLDLYSAGVQIVLAQGRINAIKQSIVVSNDRLQIEARHFPDQECYLQLQVLQREAPKEEGGNAEGVVSPRNGAPHHVVMVDNDTQDVPARVEAYMREALPELIKREPSNFMQVTLQTAMKIASTANDELLKKSLELWGLVELLDRERQWQIAVKTGVEEVPYNYIRDDEDEEVFTTICLQLAAAAERKASATSKALLTGMQRVLQDSKVKIDFNMYYATLILLNCVEKSTWAFKAWDQPNLRQLWPLEKNPGEFTDQGYVIADLLRMLLKIRKALPQTIRRESDGKLVTEEQDPVMQEYFEAIGLDCKFRNILWYSSYFIVCQLITMILQLTWSRPSKTSPSSLPPIPGLSSCCFARLCSSLPHSRGFLLSPFRCCDGKVYGTLWELHLVSPLVVSGMASTDWCPPFAFRSFIHLLVPLSSFASLHVLTIFPMMYDPT